MRDRLKKKTEKRKREQIHRLLDLVLDINGLEERKQSVTGNLPTAFFDFSGHVGWVDVQIFTNGWTPDKSPDTKILSHTRSSGELAYTVRRLESIKAETPGAATPRESR